MATPSPRPAHFDVWGCRGSRSFLPARSRIGNSTSCYSLLASDVLMVLDAGRGLSALGQAMEMEDRFRGVRKIHVLVSHAHLDHWEGLKDVSWFWHRNNGLEVTVWGSAQALGAIQHGFAHPSYVPLDLLAQGTVASLSLVTVGPHERRPVDGWRIETFALNHASGRGVTRRKLETLGYKITAPGGGPTVAYLLDHEPAADTHATESAMLEGAHIAVYDAHFSAIADQHFGHGSQEHAAAVARRHPDSLVLAGHHGPMYSDEALRDSYKRYARGAPNFHLAAEGKGYSWNAREARFERRPSQRARPGAAEAPGRVPALGAKPS